MSTDNLILTEHAIKRHAKRLQKQMKNYNQDLSLGESQNLLSKILGFNDWNHLNTILKPAIENYEKDKIIIDKMKIYANNELQGALACDLNSHSIYFSEEIQRNLSSDIQNDFLKLHNNFLNYEKQNQTLDKINLEFAQILSTFPCYFITKKSVVLGNHLYSSQKSKSIFNILNFIKKYKNNLDYNVKSKEGLPVLAILLIFYQNGDGNIRYIENSKKKELYDLFYFLLEKTNLNQTFLKIGHFLDLVLINHLTQNSKSIISFLNYTENIPENLFLKFLDGSYYVIPELDLIKLLLKKTIKNDINKYVLSIINCLLSKPSYVTYYRSDYSYVRKILSYFINQKYSYDVNLIRKNILENTLDINTFEITDNIKYIIDCIPELITSEFKIQLKNTIQQNNDYSKYFIKTLKLNK